MEKAGNVINIALLSTKSFPFDIGEVICFSKNNMIYKITGKKPIKGRDGWFNTELTRIYSAEKINYSW